MAQLTGLSAWDRIIFMKQLKTAALAVLLLLCLVISCSPPPEPADDKNAEKSVPAPEAQPPPEFTLTAVGDVMLDNLTSKRLRHYDPEYPFAVIAPVLKEGDLVLANLECPLSLRGKAVSKRYTFCADPSTIEALTASGISLVSLANNHILDYGVDALEDTLELLEERGIAYVGAGRNEAEARKGASLEINGVKTAVLAYSGVFQHGYPAWRAGPDKPGTLFYPEKEQFIADIEKARRWADVVIVSLHWGDEYTYQVNEEQMETGRLAVDSGADLVLGHHSHTPQGIEIYKGKPIVYSLGNFLFYPFQRTYCNESFILQASVGKNGVESIRLVPVLLGDSQPYPATGQDAVRLRTLITGLLDEFETPWEPDRDEIIIRW